MSEKRRRALLVVNGNSGRAASAQAAVARLAEGGIELHRHTLGVRERLADVIESRRDDVDCVVLGGGDGTLNGAAIGLRRTGLPLGILPLGTANDLARSLGLPLDPVAAAEVILAGRVRRVDLGLVNGHPFFNAASIGLSAEVTRRLTGSAKRWLGALAYPFLALRVALTARRFGALLRHGNEGTRVKTLQITVGNGRYYGGGAVVHPESQIDDHLLHVYSLEAEAGWRLLTMAHAFKAGRHTAFRSVRTLAVPALEILTRHPENVSADGELVTVTPARFAVAPASVAIYVP